MGFFFFAFKEEFINDLRSQEKWIVVHMETANSLSLGKLQREAGLPTGASQEKLNT